MQITKIQITDYPQMYSFWIKNSVFMELDMSFESISAFVERNKNTCLLIKNNENIIGTLLASYDGFKCHIYHIVIDIDYRRNGYGTKLINKLKEYCTEEKCSKITISTYKTNDHLRKFLKQNLYNERDDFSLYVRHII